MGAKAPSEAFCNLICSLAAHCDLPMPDDETLEDGAVDFPFQNKVFAIFERQTDLIIEHAFAIVRKPISEKHLGQLLARHHSNFVIDEAQQVLFIRRVCIWPWSIEKLLEHMTSIHEATGVWQEEVKEWPELICLP